MTTDQTYMSSGVYCSYLAKRAGWTGGGRGTGDEGAGTRERGGGERGKRGGGRGERGRGTGEERAGWVIGLAG